MIVESHNDAGPLAFYLPGRPRVLSAGRFLGLRRSPYDYFADTDLAAAGQDGRPAMFVGGSERLWRWGFTLDEVQRAGSDPPLFTTRIFGGPRRRGA